MQNNAYIRGKLFIGGNAILIATGKFTSSMGPTEPNAGSGAEAARTGLVARVDFAPVDLRLGALARRSRAQRRVHGLTGIFVPSATPKAGLEPLIVGPEDAITLWKADIERQAVIIKRAGMKIE